MYGSSWIWGKKEISHSSSHQTVLNYFVLLVGHPFYLVDTREQCWADVSTWMRCWFDMLSIDKVPFHSTTQRMKTKNMTVSFVVLVKPMNLAVLMWENQTCQFSTCGWRVWAKYGGETKGHGRRWWGRTESLDKLVKDQEHISPKG